MIEITDNLIEEIAINSGEYRKGCQLTGRVKDFSYNEEENFINGHVEGAGDYNVFVEFNSKGSIKSYQCECDTSYVYEGACKHIVALLKAAKEKFRVKKYKGNIETYLPFSMIEESNKKGKKAYLSVEQHFMLFRDEEIYLRLQLKVGDGRFYKVRDIPALLTAIEEKREFVFTRKYEIDFAKVFFDGMDKQIINLLISILKKERKQQKFVKPYYLFHSNEYSIFEKDSVMLFEDNLKSYLEIIEGADLSVDCFGAVKDMKIMDDLNVEVQIEEKAGVLVMEANYNTDVKIMALTDDFEYVLDPYQATVYKISESKRNLVKKIHMARYRKIKPVFKIEKHERVNFFKEYLPKIENSCKVHMSEAVKEKIIERALIPKIYLDLHPKGISARVDFCYGDEVVSPGIPGSEEGILLRDVENEKRVLDFLVSAGFRFHEGLFFIEKEEQMAELLLNKIEKLKEMAEVYYSNDFKEIEVRNVNKMHMGVRMNANTHLLELEFKIDDFSDEELTDLISSLKQKKKYHRLRNGSMINLHDRELINLSQLFDDLDISSRNLENSTVRLPANRALFVDSYIKEKNIKDIRKSENFERLVEEILNPSDLRFDLDDKLNGVLRDYQKFGFRWMKTLAHYGFGGILADDMGLGKTLQVLAFIKSESRSSENPNLVVAPTSLIYNWKAEAEKFVPELRVNIISGTKGERRKQIEQIDECDIAVTSFGSLKRDMESYNDKVFSYVFVDEAQHIKNPATLNAESVKSLSAKGYFALTGTPIENTLTELWSIFDFVMPGYLMNHHKFVTKFEAPIVKNHDQDALRTFSRYIKPFVLRRVKQDVLKELPEKIESIVASEMIGEQKKIYAAFLKKAQGEIMGEIEENGFERSKLKILAALTRLRQICCHPATFIENYRGGSGKLETLLEIIEDSIAANHQILVFSQFTSMLEIIDKELKKLHIPCFYLDGSTKAEDRMNLVNRFNSFERPVFLISLKAGGTGLNLTGADMVIHFDPWWNPAVENQATDRAYRLGQTRVVQVFKLIAKGTIEEKIIELQNKKRDLINSVIESGENLLTKLSEKEIRELFQLGEAYV
ncbi:MAG: SNF2 helicase associated domain-containing protein [Clostridia bacterium]|nr:SNF2 helicase associated domain-containing protein [Clostridia bacterium]